MKFISILGIIVSIFLVFSTQKSNTQINTRYTTVWGDSRLKSLPLKKYYLNENGKKIDILSNNMRTESISPVIGSQPFITILCKFAGVNKQPKNLTYFKNMYSNIYPGLDNYWRELSYNKINLLGSKVTGWYILPHTRAYYFSTYDYLYYIAKDCTSLADNNINFTLFKGINIMLNDDIDGYSYGGKINMELDGLLKNWMITWIPDWAYQDIVVVEHEMGHAFGLSHSSVGSYEYGNQWDIMSDMWSWCENSTSKIYGCLGQSTIAYHKDKLGWIPLGRKYIAKHKSSTIILEQLELPKTNHYLMIQVPINGSSTHFYTVEVRNRIGYDKKLPIKAVIIHEVHANDDIMIVSARLITNPREAWKVGQKFIDVKNNISIKIIAETPTGFKIIIKNNSLK